MANEAVSGFPDGGPGTAVRRAPFSANPRVGVRGQRTQQRILDAALRVFGEDGYHQCSIDRIAKVSGCSRVSVYQYFAGKEDVFRHLAGQVARQLSASTEALDPLTADAAGWIALRSWVTRYADVYDRYEPVFHVFPVALESDDALAAETERMREQTIARFHSRVASSDLPPRRLDIELTVLVECLTRTLDVSRILRSVAPESLPRGRVEDAMTDVVHRTLFGLQRDVNVHPHADERPPDVRFRPEMWEMLRNDAAGDGAPAGGRGALNAILESGRDVFAQRGYHRTRVDDITTAAGVSHGAFYRYFKNKDHLARILMIHAIRTVSVAFLEIPEEATRDGAAARAALRRWLRRYNEVHSHEAAMLQVWLEASLQDATMRADSAPPLDWGRRRMARFLEGRGFGDFDTEAVLMVALLGSFGVRQRSAPEIDAAVDIIERGLLGR